MIEVHISGPSDQEASTTSEAKALHSLDAVLADPQTCGRSGGSQSERESARLKRSDDNFDLDLVKRRVKKPFTSYLMEPRSRDRARRTVLNVLLFPLHLSWWWKKAPKVRPYLCQLSILYVVHMASTLRELASLPKRTTVSHVELFMPILLLVMMAFIFGQAAASSQRSPRMKTNPPCVPATSCTLPSQSDNEDASRKRTSKARQSRLRNVKKEETDFEDDDHRTASSESSLSDSQSDSSDDQSPQRSKRFVAARRSSMLTILPPNTNGTPETTIHSPSVQDTAKLNPARKGAKRFLKNSPHTRSSSTRNMSTKEPFIARFPWRRAQSSRRDLLSIRTDPTGLDEYEDDSDTEEEGKYDEKLLKGEHARRRFFSHSIDEVSESVKSVQWSADGPEKVLLTTLQIREELEQKVFEARLSEHYKKLALAGALVIASIPVLFRAWLFSYPLSELLNVADLCLVNMETAEPVEIVDEVTSYLMKVFGFSVFGMIGVLTSFCSTFVLAWTLLGHAAGAVETFKRRFLYAKYFSKLTSSRKARRADLPYFRLHKVDHIKVWLSLRSKRLDLDKEFIGPYKVSDTISYVLFMTALFLVGAVAFRAVQNFSNSNPKMPLKVMNGVPSTLGDWFLVCWAMILAVYVQRIMSLASKTHDKFQNTSVLLTEELNIHMRLLRKPEKKDELVACNSMLKTAAALIKELEGGNGKKGHTAALVLDPWLYSLVRVILLSALGALSSDLFGFRVRLWKI